MPFVGIREGSSDFLGLHADLLEEHRRRSESATLFRGRVGEKKRRHARSSDHKMDSAPTEGPE